VGWHNVCELFDEFLGRFRCMRDILNEGKALIILC
jgi:hypothetical protein